MNEAKEINSKLPLSVLILTNRSDDRFIRALASVQFAHEVLIFDNDSQNDWVSLSKNYNFKVIPTGGIITDFAQVRNQALEYAQHNWVLFLDSDEILESNAAELIDKIIKDNLYEGVLIKRSDIFLGKKLRYGEAGTTYLVRLARKRQLQFFGPVHEEAIIPGSVGQSQLEILHYSHHSVAEFLSDVGNYSRLAARGRRTSLSVTVLELILFPTAKFLVNYFLKFGFLDGWRGLVYAVMMSLHSLFVRIYRLQDLLMSEQR